MESLKGRRDVRSCSRFIEAQHQHLRALDQQNGYWKQRAKIFWLKDGDQNTTFFHNAVRRRRQRNRITKLKRSDGTWADRGNGLNELITEYFHVLFNESSHFLKPVLDCFERKISESKTLCLLISDNILLAYETNHFLNRKTSGNMGSVGMKIDMSKAYDRVNWDLVEGIIEKLGFCNDFVAMVSGCIRSVRANSYEVNVLKAILEEFSDASGQQVNLGKSDLTFSRNVDGPSREVVTEIIGFGEGNQRGKYLGVPSLVGRRKNEVLGFINDKILSKIRSWNNRFLSRAGREILIKNVLQAVPTYAMSTFLLPKDLCRNVENSLNRFWWKGSLENGKGINWKCWKDLCKPKACGGMGFRRMREFNLALLGKQGWRFMHYPDSLVTKVFKAKYFRHCSFLEARLGTNPSFVWCSIMEAQGALKDNCKWRVGDEVLSMCGRILG
ncbi:PREDICTED: uncharacterized protein LOC109162711 [Ipomoea nil]|uniref:uncharacterized protein LOC109162711 n=1 Tax=Ipomoea nil TaxID=35883 RepID=UPI000901D626|nr:PREDICTED: uncharacterized protein LOC109162711 [Ipomoea nil]